MQEWCWYIIIWYPQIYMICTIIININTKKHLYYLKLLFKKPSKHKQLNLITHNQSSLMPSWNIDNLAIYSTNAPNLRSFLACILETRVDWVCGARGAGNPTSLNVKSKGRESCECGAVWLRGPGSMVVWWSASPWYG